MLTIYTPMAGGLAEEALNALTLLVGSNTFHSALNIGMTLGIGGMAYQYITGNKFKSILSFTVMSFAILFILVGLKLPVSIIDMQKPMVAHEVDDVPAGVAIPAAFVSEIGYGISKAFDWAFHMPDEKGYNETGMIFGSRIALASSSANFGMTPQLSTDLSNYMRQCVWIAKVQVARNLTVSQIVQSPTLMTTLFATPSPIYHVILGKEGNVSCLAAAKILHNKLISAATAESTMFADTFTDGDTAKFDSHLSEAQNTFLNISTTGTNLLIQNMLINKVRGSVQDAMAFTGNTASMMNYTNTAAMNNLRIAEANTFWMAGYRLPMLNAALWILIMCLFPVVILLGFSPLFKRTFSSFVMTMVWLWTWPPMFTVLNFFISYYASTKTTIFGNQDLGITMSNIHSLNMIHSDMAFTAGFLAMAIPFIAKGITSGFADAFTNAAQYLGSMTHGVSQSIASQVSHGNVSVGNFSGWNANYDNTSAHKHDINQTDYRGMDTHQLANGETVMQTASGFNVINTAGAMSQMAVGIHGSQALVSSLSHNAQVAQHRADSLRTSADNSLQSAMRQADNFNTADANDYRSGGGISNTDTYGINADYWNMADAVHQFNAGRSAAHQITADQAANLSIDSNKEIFGKAAALATGVSGSARFGFTHQHQQSNDLKEFQESKEGQTYSQAFTHAVAAAKNIHMDGSTSHNLSHAEQSAADFARASSLSHQASAEYSRSQNYTQAASIASSNSQSINSNMNNAFQAWAVDTKGDGAMSTLTSTDGASIAKAQSWGQEFLGSSQGQSLLNQEASNLMSQVHSGSDLGAYNEQSGALGSNANVQGKYAADSQKVNAMGGQVQSMNKKQLSEAQGFAQRARHQDLMKQSIVTQSQVTDQMHSGQQGINTTGASTEDKVKGEFKTTVAAFHPSGNAAESED